MHSLRLARAFTRKEKIVKLEGGYHGSYDYMLYSTYTSPNSYGNTSSPIAIPYSSGIPNCLNNLILTIPFNNFEVLEKVVKDNYQDIAAIITEPMLGNYGCADPITGYMDMIRKLCDNYGILWILDEVKTGFRVAKGGHGE